MVAVVKGTRNQYNSDFLPVNKKASRVVTGSGCRSFQDSYIEDDDLCINEDEEFSEMSGSFYRYSDYIAAL